MNITLSMEGYDISCEWPLDILYNVAIYLLQFRKHYKRSSVMPKNKTWEIYHNSEEPTHGTTFAKCIYFIEEEAYIQW